MAKEKKQREVLLSGPNIYRDKHGIAIYYSKRKGAGYRISKDKENTFKTLQARFVIAAIIFIFMYFLLTENLYISIPVTIAAAIYLQYRFTKFLDTCPVSIGFEPGEHVSRVDQMIDTPMAGLILRFVLYFALAILLVINTFVSKQVYDNTPLRVASYAVAIAGLYMAYKYLLVIIRKKDK